MKADDAMVIAVRVQRRLGSYEYPGIAGCGELYLIDLNSACECVKMKTVAFRNIKGVRDIGRSLIFFR